MSKIIEVKDGDTTLRVGAGWLSIEPKVFDAACKIESVILITAPYDGGTKICFVSPFHEGGGDAMKFPIKFSEVMRAIREAS